MNNTLTRLAIFVAFFINTIASNAQSWTLAGPNDADQPAPINNYSSGHVLAYDLGRGYYLAYRDWTYLSPGFAGQRLSVRHWDGSSWQYVGSPAFSGEYGYMDITTGTGQVPYVVYQDYSASRKAVVKTFNGTSWVSVGIPVSPGSAEYTRIAMDASGKPFVAYIDSPASRKVTVKKWDGTVWQLVGAANFTQANITNVRVAVGSSGMPQVLVQFYSASTGSTAEVYRFNGTAWVSAGMPSGSASIELASFAVGKNDTPLVAYTDYSFSRRVTVRKFDGSSWVNVGASNITRGTASTVQLIADTIKGLFLYSVADTALNGSNPIYAQVRRFNGAAWVIAGIDTMVTPRQVYSNNNNNSAMVVDTAGAPAVFLFDYKYRLLKLTGNNWVPQGSTQGITGEAALSVKLASSPDGKKAYAITGADYYLSSPYNSKIYRYDTGWTLIGQSGVGGLKGNAVAIAVHPNGEPWIVLRDSGMYTKYSVWKHTPAGWSYAGLTDTTTDGMDFSIDKSGNVYFGLRPYNASGLKVNKFDGTSWTKYPILKDGNVFRYVRIRGNSNGIPYILAGGHISTHPNYLYAFEVYNWSGAAWQSLGGIFNTANGTYYVGDPDLELDSADIPYIAFPNTGQYTAKVQKFDVVNGWKDVVTTGTEPKLAYAPEIEFAQDGSLYLSCADRNISPVGNITVRRLNGTSWQTVGAPSFSKSVTDYPSFAILNNRLLAALSDGGVYAYKYDCAQPAVVIAQPRDTVICAGQSGRIVVQSNGATAYRWQYNSGKGWYNVPGNIVYAGVDDDTLRLNGVTMSMDGMRYRCVLNNTCGTSNITEAVTLRVDTTWAAPAVTINADRPVSCAGSTVTFRATPVNKGVLYSYEWYVNGSQVAGATDSVFTTNTLNNGDAVTCKLTRMSACGIAAVSASSSPFTAVVNPSASPTVSITANPGGVITPGQSVTFNATVTNEGFLPQYQWLLNANPIPGATLTSYTSSTLANGDVVALQIKRNDTCATPGTVVSAGITIVQWPVSVKGIQSRIGNVQVYPQPARDYVVLSNLSSIDPGVYDLQLYNVNGQKMLNEKFTVDKNTATHRVTIPASIPSGTYMLKISGNVVIAEGSLVISR